MKLIPFTSAIAAAMLIISGCASHGPKPPANPPATGPGHGAGSGTAGGGTGSTTTGAGETGGGSTHGPATNPKPESEQFAVPIPGKPGFMTDPNDPKKQPLDVRDLPPGTKIESPFTKKILTIPPQ